MSITNKESIEIEAAVNKALDDMPETFSIKSFLMENREKVMQMCIAEYEEEKKMALFKAEGKMEGTLEAIINIMHSLDLSLDKAMDAIGVAVNEREKYTTLVKAELQLRND